MLAEFIVVTLMAMCIIVIVILTRGILHTVSDLDSQRWEPQAIHEDSIGVAAAQGRRPYMEDTFHVTVLDHEQKTLLVAVFDGHGGDRCAEYVAKNVKSTLLRFDYINEPARALEQTFLALDEEWLELADKYMWDDGSTGVVALIQNGVVYVANAGDSRAVMSQRGDAEPLSEDHKPNLTSEKARILECKGSVMYTNGTWRVQGVLAVSRAFGDRRIKRYITAKPDVIERTIYLGDDYLVLATDGLWDVVQNQQAINVVRSNDGNMKAAAAMLNELAHSSGTMDNTTVLIVDLREWTSNPQPPPMPSYMEKYADLLPNLKKKSDA